MKAPSIKKNFILKLLYEVLMIAAPLITAPYVARVLGADGVGIYSYTSSNMAYFTLFAALGTLSYGMREISRNRDDACAASKLFWEIELMTVFTSIVSFAGWVIVIVCSDANRPYYIALVPVLLATMFDISWFYTGYEKINYTVTINSLCKILGVVLLFVLIKEKDDVLLYTIINSCVQLLGSLSMWLYLPKLLKKTDFRKLTFKRHFKETLVYFIPTIAASVYKVLDKSLLGLIKGDNFENGFYEEAVKIISVPKSLSYSALNGIMESRMSYLYSQKKFDEIHIRIDRSMNFIYFIGFGCTFGMIGIASRFVPFFLGEGYEPVVYLVYLMSPIILIIGTSNCLGAHYYNPFGLRMKSAKIVVLGAAINFALDLALIPFFAANGAVIGSIVAELVVTVIYVILSNKYMTFKKLFLFAWKKIIAGGIMCALVMWLDKALAFSNILVIAIQLVAGAASYFVILLVLRDEMMLFFIKTGFKTVGTFFRKITNKTKA